MGLRLRDRQPSSYRCSCRVGILGPDDLASLSAYGRRTVGTRPLQRPSRLALAIASGSGARWRRCR
jgi:hypothetical protein